MKKYKLLKDLPRAKAGEIVIITNAHSNTAGILKINKWNEDETQRPRLAFIHTKNVDEWLEEIQEPKNVWELKKWDSYWFISNTDIFGDIITDYEEFKVNYLNIGNAFSTQKEARKELNKRKALQRVRKYCYDNNIKLFSDEELKEILNDNIYKHHSKGIYFYYMYYHAMDKKFNISFASFVKYIHYFYFKKKEDVEQVIQNCENDLKIIFNV